MLFPKYKIVEYTVAHTTIVYGIHKRCLLIGYSPLIHQKMVIFGGRYPLMPSTEKLTFATEKEAQEEIDRLNLGKPPIKSITWEKGKIKEVKYG